jgi:hypothetical protein
MNTFSETENEACIEGHSLSAELPQHTDFKKFSFADRVSINPPSVNEYLGMSCGAAHWKVLGFNTTSTITESSPPKAAFLSEPNHRQQKP